LRQEFLSFFGSAKLDIERVYPYDLPVNINYFVYFRTEREKEVSFFLTQIYKILYIGYFI